MTARGTDTLEISLIPLLVLRGRERMLAAFTCPNRCGYGFGNVPPAEAANKAVHHAENCEVSA